MHTRKESLAAIEELKEKGPTSKRELSGATHRFLHLSVKAMPLGLRWESRMADAVCLCHSRIGMAG